MRFKALILAAGQGTRMKSQVPKVLHKVGGISILEHVIKAVADNVNDVGIVLGNGYQQVKENLPNGPHLEIFKQKERLGTGHAVKIASDFFKDESSYIMVLPGDIPLITKEYLQKFIEFVENTIVDCSILTFTAENPFGYGRVITKDNSFIKIVEEKDATNEEKLIQTVNSGIYIFKAQLLKKYLMDLKNINVQNEYYLTDIPELMKNDGKVVKTLNFNDETSFLGVNNRIQLATADRICNYRKLNSLMLEGVTILNPNTVRIENNVSIGNDSIIYPSVSITGNTEIGINCEIKNGVIISNSKIGDKCLIKPYSTIEESNVGSLVEIGPMANLRPGTNLDNSVKVGNFVETKKAFLKKGVKASHLTYLGDCEIGENTNIGAGTITCNYDGKNKFKTKIGKNSFIGSDTQLVAPVTLQDNTYVGAGSTITKDVPKNALALSRVKQINIKDWALKKRK